MKRIVATFLLLAGSLLPPAAAAVTCTTSAQVVAFGSYNPLATSPKDSTGQVSVQCSNLLSLLVSYSVSLSTGISGSYSLRQLASGSRRLGYNLFTDPARQLVWGNGTSGSNKVSNSFLVVLGGISANHTVYGRIPARQNVGVGNYSDTITVTVDY